MVVIPIVRARRGQVVLYTPRSTCIIGEDEAIEEKYNCTEKRITLRLSIMLLAVAFEGNREKKLYRNFELISYNLRACLLVVAFRREGEMILSMEMGSSILY